VEKTDFCVRAALSDLFIRIHLFSIRIANLAIAK